MCCVQLPEVLPYRPANNKPQYLTFAVISNETCKDMQDYNKEKLTQHVVNMDNMTVEAASALHNAHTVFCALGTTRKVPHNSLGCHFCQSTPSRWQYRLNSSALPHDL